MGLKKVALVTGATRGIGLAISEMLIKEGISLIGTSRLKANVEEVATDLSTDSTKMHAMELDITDRNSISKLLSELEEKALAPNILINNAAITRDNLLMKMRDEEWDSVLGANLDAVFHLTRNLIRPMLKARYGRIVNISSVVGLSGNAGQSNYVAAKAGIIGFTKSLALESAKRGVTANVVAPGFIDTDMTRALSESQRNAIIERVPAQKMGNVNDVASAVKFLISDGASYITGETINVNGGLLMN